MCFSLGLFCMGLFWLLDLIEYFLYHVRKIFNYNLFKNFYVPFLFLFFFWEPYNSNVGALILSQTSLRLPSVLFILFTLFFSSEVISTILSSSSLIYSSASDILLLIPSRVFLVSVIVLFVSVCLFFNSYTSLLIDSWIFSILFTRFFIICYYYSECFSGSLPISSSSIWTSVFLVCSFISVVFLCLFINFLNLLCLRSPFHRLQGWILSSFWFLPSWGWSSGLCKLCIGWDACWIFICLLFAFPLMNKAEWGGNPVCGWLGLYFCFVCCLDEAFCTVCYWWLDDSRSCIQVVSFVWGLTIWYSLGLVLWLSRFLESVLPLQRLGAWYLFRNENSTSGLLWH